MEPGDALTTNKLIRSHKTGVVLPRKGVFVSTTENLGRQLILVNFGAAGEEYLFADEVVDVLPNNRQADPKPAVALSRWRCS